jgi:ADP-ribosylation factor-binding protein GGA
VYSSWRHADTLQELGNALASAHPKIQKMCEEESDDHEAVAKLLEINDSIHRTLNRYRLTKRGEYEAAQQIPKGTLGTSGAGVGTGPGNELSLIDLGGFDEPAPVASNAQADPLGDIMDSGPSQSAASAAPAQGGGLEDDLLGLSLDAPPIRLGGAPTARKCIQLIGGFPILTIIASVFPSGMNPGSGTHTPTPSNTYAQPPKPNYNALSSLGMGMQGQASSTSGARTSLGGTQAKHDPFAALSGLSGPASRTASPMPFQQAPHPPAQASSAAPQASLLGGGDDDWAFSSSVGGHELVVTNSNIKVIFSVTRPGSPANVLQINSSVSNNTPQPVSDFTFLLAVTKVKFTRTLREAMLTSDHRVLRSSWNLNLDEALHQIRLAVSHRIYSYTAWK